ncbi:MAG: hypothetical protein O3A82_07210 [Verrucomicrobia bacterium]|jgi:hypothetical protein|nr:hypothetical protein [Verrucomicrobiota bacterium]
MKFEFTQKEYRTLVDILTLSGMILDAYGRGEDSSRKGCFELEQKIYSYFEDVGSRDLIMRDPSTGQYVRKWSSDRSETIVKILDEYVDASFWEELIVRMAERDMLADLELQGKDQSKLTLEERETLLRKYGDRYDREFRSNGLKSIISRSESSEGTN